MLLKKILLFNTFLAFVLISCSNHSVNKEYDSKGNLIKTIEMANGKPDGVTTLYNGGKIIAQANFLNGVQEGVTRKYFLNGNLEKFVVFHNGVAEDSQVIYNPNGTIRELSHLVHGEKFGYYKMNSTNGSPFWDGFTFKGYQDSTWVTYDSVSGLIKNIELFKRGIKIKQIDTTDLTFKKIDTNSLPFIISVPSNWKIKLNDGKYLLTIEKKDTYKKKVILPYITIRTTEIKHADFSTDFNQSVKALLKTGQISKIISKKNLKIDTKQAYELIWIGSFNNNECGFVSTSIVNNGRAYTLACSSAKDNISLYAELFKEMARSIHFR